jgi:hypothetical protein
MSNKFDYYEYSVCSHWLSAIINCDFTGLEDDEHQQLNEWLQKNEQRGSHWDCDEDSLQFAIDEISGLYADCITLRQYFPKH